MIIHNAKKENTGDWSFDLQVTNDEVEQLVNLSVKTLIAEGIISLVEQEEAQTIEMPYQIAPTSQSVN